MDLSNVSIKNYVVSNNELVEVSEDVISLSKNLTKINALSSESE